MRIIVAPAGYHRDGPDKDAALIAEIHKQVGEVEWGVQVTIPHSIKAGTYLSGITGPYWRDRVMRKAARWDARLPMPGVPFLNYEAQADFDEDHVTRGKVVRLFARECLRWWHQRPICNYATPRVSNRGEVGDPGAWIHEAFACGSRALFPTGYIREGVPPRPLGFVAQMAALCGYDLGVFASGQYAGDQGLVPETMLRGQAEAYRRDGVETVIVWCNLATPFAVAGVVRCVGAWRETA